MKTMKRCAGIGELIGVLFAMVVSISCGCNSATLAAAISADDADKRARSTPTAKPDAEFLLWSQHWTLNEDKSTSYREHWQVRINDGRAIGRFGDPRISHVKGSDKLTIHKAQTTLPNGEVLPVPDYSFNIAATDEVAGWPEYADWQDMIVSFSGIENGAVVELDYEIASPAGTWPWFDGLVRLNDVYPIAERSFSVLVPAGIELHHQTLGTEGLSTFLLPCSISQGSGQSISFTILGLQGERDEPLAAPWAHRAPRLAFSTCPKVVNMSETQDVDSWRKPFVAAVEKAAKPDAAIEKFAKKAIENEVDPAEQALKVSKKLRDSFNFVESPKALRSLACRNASVVLNTNYGNTLESAALLYASLKSLGLECSLYAVADGEKYQNLKDIAPSMTAFDGIVVNVRISDRDILVHPKLGEITNPGSWGRKYLRGGPSDLRPKPDYVRARGDERVSNIQISGKVTLDKDAKAAGDLRIRADGTFLNNDVFGSSDSQKKWLGGVVDRVLTGFEVSSFSVRELDNENFIATCKVATKEAFKKPGGRYLVGLGTGPATLNAINFPLERSERQSDVRVGTTIKEEVQISIELPDGWTGLMTEQPFDAKDSAWGSVNEGLSQEKNSIRFARTLSIEKDQLTPTAFLSMREALNELRSNSRRVILLKEKSDGQLVAQDVKPK